MIELADRRSIMLVSIKSESDLLPASPTECKKAPRWNAYQADAAGKESAK
jgi:hypothetical protein